MNANEAVRLLGKFDAELRRMSGATFEESRFQSWQHRTLSVLTSALGETHHITQDFVQLPWATEVYVGDPVSDTNANRDAFTRAAKRARGLIDAAIFDLAQLSRSTDVAEDAGCDPDLWDHVKSHVIAGEWAKVASQTSIFTEDRIRTWADRSAKEVGEVLMTAVFGEHGDYRLGLTPGERQGWHRFAMGIAMAVRNVDAHRIQDRPDIKRYAIGVLGASSLLLTQMRYEHGNRVHHTSPTTKRKPAKV